MLGKLWNGFTTLLVVLAVVLAVLLVGMRLIGFQVFSVLSGSMEPNFHVGSLIYVRETDPHSLQVGDPITFMVSETTVVTHRITGIHTDSDPNVLWFQTKGDANDTDDSSLVHSRNVIGKAVFSIPYLGYVSAFIQNPPGLYIALGCGALALVAAFWPEGKRREEASQ